MSVTLTSHLPKKVGFIYLHESHFKKIKDVFCFILKALFVLKIFNFLSLLFWAGHIGKQVDKKVKVNFKIFDVTN